MLEFLNFFIIFELNSINIKKKNKMFELKKNENIVTETNCEKIPLFFSKTK